MSDNTNVTPANDSAVIHKISFCVYQAILEIQQQQPEFLKEKYRTIPWHDTRHRSTLRVKLEAGISNTQDQELLIRKVQKFLEILLIPNYFELPHFSNLISKLCPVIQQLAESNPIVCENTAQANEPLSSPIAEKSNQFSNGIAILLLDAENLQINANTEKFLEGICNYPIQIKIAFANWRNMGKQDVEFHNRGYELIHVPAAKDSADVKMATVGSSIFVHYPTAREVLVCSSDGVLTHLCNTLQTHGLNVYQIRQQGNIINILNTQTHQTQTHYLEPIRVIPSLEDFVNQLKVLIQSEQKRTNNHWIRLSQISSLFQETSQISISQVVSHHLPGKRARDIFIDNPAIFSIHQVSDKSEIYINLFDASSIDVRDINHSYKQSELRLASKTLAEVSLDSEDQAPLSSLKKAGLEEADSAKTNINLAINKINSKQELEQVIIKVIESTKADFPGGKIPISKLGSMLKTVSGESANSITKKLKLGSNLTKFLKSCTSFTIENSGSNAQVILSQSSLCEIKSSNELERYLFNILKSLVAKSPQNKIPLEILGSEFHKQYGKPVSAIIKELKLGDNLVKFIQSCSTFKIEKKGKGYQITIAVS
ncbi:NYN domain-containing protein [Allocoleopsis franciscana]|uniref:HTH OST-type domain-containing protein n=1 Tax=Allocoleopsis franciscana PCC 7113 TaxID=1173027 RepID=K9WJL8_9CYAN|nr:OST-HTH/LOTUS domain-containing protein [Allocoleopsis franciscana]AFZ19969.1 Protein of unknown function DUF88 [Allocoleopsis franciscana PCC 7113]